jgi:hypothetical protein
LPEPLSKRMTVGYGQRTRPKVAQCFTLDCRYDANVRLGSWSCQNGLGISRGSQSPAVFQTVIAAINGLTPMMFMSRVRL